MEETTFQKYQKKEKNMKEKRIENRFANQIAILKCKRPIEYTFNILFMYSIKFEMLRGY